MANKWKTTTYLLMFLSLTNRSLLLSQNQGIPSYFYPLYNLLSQFKITVCYFKRSKSKNKTKTINTNSLQKIHTCISLETFLTGLQSIQSAHPHHSQYFLVLPWWQVVITQVSALGNLEHWVVPGSKRLTHATMLNSLEANKHHRVGNSIDQKETIW